MSRSSPPADVPGAFVDVMATLSLFLIMTAVFVEVEAFPAPPMVGSAETRAVLRSDALEVGGQRFPLERRGDGRLRAACVRQALRAATSVELEVDDDVRLQDAIDVADALGAPGRLSRDPSGARVIDVMLPEASSE